MSLDNKFDILYLGSRLDFDRIKKPLILTAENLKEKINFDFSIEELNYLTMDVILSLRGKDYDIYIIGDLEGRENETMKFIKEEKSKPNILPYHAGHEDTIASHCSRLMRAKFRFEHKKPFLKI